MVTLRDLARQLNLSPSLVSGVLNNRPGIWASDETRRRVQEAAETAAYRPNQAARALRSGKTRCVALVVDDHFPGTATAIHQMSRFLTERDHRLMILPAPDSDDELVRIDDLASSRWCDMAVLWCRHDAAERAGQHLEKHKIPFAARGHFAPHWLQIDFADDFAAARVPRSGKIALLEPSTSVLYETENAFQAASEMASARKTDALVERLCDEILWPQLTGVLAGPRILKVE